MSTKRPGDFTTTPWNSVFRNAESEIIAMNIMVILKRTGNTFRELTYDEYEAERKKDGNYSTKERVYFDKVIGYCKSPENAAIFSPNWSSKAKP
jgi:hypothetical protein